jgi:hypothetical protein
MWIMIPLQTGDRIAPFREVCPSASRSCQIPAPGVVYDSQYLDDAGGKSLQIQPGDQVRVAACSATIIPSFN